MNKRELRYYIENYEYNLNEANDLCKQYNEINYKLSAEYGQTFAGGDFKSSKIENYIIKKDRAMSKLKMLEKKIAIVNIAVVVLTDEEREVIEKMKIWQNKTKIIASTLNVDKKHVERVRERSLKKMCEYLNSIGK